MLRLRGVLRRSARAPLVNARADPGPVTASRSASPLARAASPFRSRFALLLAAAGRASSLHEAG